MACAVPGCKSHSSTFHCFKQNNDVNISFHRFPQNYVYKKKWLEAINKPDWIPKDRRICSKHFTRACFVNKIDNLKWRRLETDAVPTLFLLLSEQSSHQDKCSKADVEVAGSSLEAGTSSQIYDTTEYKNTIPYFVASSDGITDGIYEADKRLLNEQALKITLARIRANPQLYIGIPKNCYHLIELLHKQTHVSITHILLCLKKIKLDTHFEELADQFGMFAEEAQDIFTHFVPILAKTLESFIVNMDSAEDIQSNLPIPLRTKRHNTSVIDSLELKVQPRTTISKELTQSERGNTVKYLISCSPDGLIDYVSPGYGGSHSDERLLENTKYLERLHPGACIIVNNGFRNAEPMLSQKGLKLLRPRAQKRSHTSHNLSQPEGLNALCSKNEDNRILNDIERVVQRVRDYTMVRDHSVISSELVRVLDEAVVIACALINLQSFVIN